jgi:hypothetical protein
MGQPGDQATPQSHDEAMGQAQPRGMTHVFQTQIEPKQRLFAVDGQNAGQVQTSVLYLGLLVQRIRRMVWWWGSMCHAIELTCREISEFDLHQMTKGCQAAF